MIVEVAAAVVLLAVSVGCALAVDRRLVVMPVLAATSAAAAGFGMLPVLAAMLVTMWGVTVPLVAFLRMAGARTAAARRVAGRNLVVVAGHVADEHELWPVVDRRGRVPADGQVVTVLGTASLRRDLLLVQRSPNQPRR